MGTPYGACGADCSGLTSQVFASFGVSTFRTTLLPSTAMGCLLQRLRPETWCSTTSTVMGYLTWG
jgi:hypothetical protein